MTPGPPAGFSRALASDSQPVLPLRPGARGTAVEDLQHRLRRVGETVTIDGHYGPETETTVSRFQAAQGLDADGLCDRHTWSALVEAGWRLGDRLLYERTPMLRGDDVAALQTHLGGLGFLDDRVDGILGPRTRGALQDFQRNCGLTVDGICGPETIVELVRLASRAPKAVKAGVVERARLRATPRQLAGRKVLVGDLGGVAALADAVAHALHGAGALVEITCHPDGSTQAHQANDLGSELYLGLSIGAPARCAYYATSGFTSEGGLRLATLIATAVGSAKALDTTVTISPMRVPVLRETRMPAVVCELAPARRVVERGAVLAEVATAAVTAWVADPLP